MKRKVDPCSLNFLFICPVLGECQQVTNLCCSLVVTPFYKSGSRPSRKIPSPLALLRPLKSRWPWRRLIVQWLFLTDEQRLKLLLLVIYKAWPTNFSEILSTYSKSCCVKHIQKIKFIPADTIQHLNQSA